MRFVGWVPCITGRLSFSRIGAEFGSHRATICNRAASPSAYIFGCEKRISRDGPLPDWVMRLFGRVPSVYYFVSMKVRQGDLTHPGAAGALPTLKHDNRGKLEGDVIVATSGWKQKPDVKQAWKRFRRLTRAATNPRLQPQQSQQLYRDAEAAFANFWRELLTSAQGGASAPAFAKASVTLWRTGQCDVDVNPTEIFTTEAAKTLQVSTPRPTSARLATRPEMQSAAAAIARQTFFFIRDLAHRHYHHSPHSDLATTTHPWSTADDETWRRETHYGLVRMAITQRREDDAQSYKQALGIVSYADAFQSHLASWKVAVSGAIEVPSQYFSYDFAALRASIDASLRQRELSDAQSRENLTYLIATVLTILGVVLASGQIWAAQNRYKECENLACTMAKSFWRLDEHIVDHPWGWLVGTLAAALLILIGKRRLFRNLWSFRAIRSGFGRFADACLATFNGVLRKPWLSWAAVLVLMGGLVLAMGGGGLWLLHYVANLLRFGP